MAWLVTRRRKRVIARRGMKLSEKIPGSLTAFVDVKSTKHVWSLWHQLNKKIKQSGINHRHDYYTVSNWDFLANLGICDRGDFQPRQE